MLLPSCRVAESIVYTAENSDRAGVAWAELSASLSSNILNADSLFLHNIFQLHFHSRHFSAIFRRMILILSDCVYNTGVGCARIQLIATSTATAENQKIASYTWRTYKHGKHPNWPTKRRSMSETEPVNVSNKKCRPNNSLCFML